MSYPNGAVAIFNEGNSVFVVDDHCYVLKNRIGDKWVSSTYIFHEAAGVLRTLPISPDESKTPAKNFIDSIKMLT